MSLPEAVTEHHGGTSALNTVLIRRNGPADRRAYSEHREVDPRNQVRGHSLGVITVPQTDAGGKATEYPREDPVAISKVPIHRIGDGVHTPVAAESAAALTQ